MSKKIFTQITLAFMLFFSLAAFNAQGQATPTIQTDLLDYPPGSTAIITGTGFTPGETVTLQVLHIDAGVDSLGTDPQHHQPWNVIADVSGNISTTWLVPIDGDALGATFKLTAEGGSSSLHAEWVFTDANTKLSNPSPTTAVFGSIINVSSTLTQQGNNGIDRKAHV